MPNYKLSSGIKDEMVGRAKVLTELVKQYGALGFPLDLARLQEAVIPDDALERFHALELMGAKDLPQRGHIIVLLRREDLPGLQRSLIVDLELPGHIYHLRGANYISSRDLNDFSRGNMHVAVPSVAEPRDQAALAKWGNAVVRSCRHAELAVHTATDAVRVFGSTGAILATWPALATLVLSDDWRKRFRNGPRKLEPYVLPSYAERRRAVMQAAEVVLAGAQLLDTYTRPPNSIQAICLSWERLPDDKVFL